MTTPRTPKDHQAGFPPAPPEAHPRADMKACRTHWSKRGTLVQGQETRHQTQDRPEAPARVDVYQRVTEALTAMLAQGVRPWMQSWASGRPLSQPVRHNGESYRGVNVLLLWMSAMEHGFSSPLWMTFKQAQSLGGAVRKGQKATLIVYADQFTPKDEPRASDEEARVISFLKTYPVFNWDQIDGLPPKAAALGSPARLDSTLTPHALAEAFFNRTGARFEQGGFKAFYRPSQDVIQLPVLAAFTSVESYVAVKAHELIHWTGHASRCAREFGMRFGDQAYAFEELVAEIGSAFLCASLGVTPMVMMDHAQYLAQWLTLFKTDHRAIFTAASQAQRAVDWLYAQASTADESASMTLGGVRP